MIALSSVSARGPAERGRARPVLANVDLEHRTGILAIIGAPKDGTTLLFDVLDGTARAYSGRVSVFGTTPDRARQRVARVSVEAPLPEAMRVDEVCELASELRGEPKAPASERLAPLGLGLLAARRIGSLAAEQRRAVALAVALTSPRVDVLLIEEPLVMLDPVAPRLVADALRARAASTCIVVTTSSARDATRLADRLGVLASGTFVGLESELAVGRLGPSGGASTRIVVSADHGKPGAAALTSILGSDESVTRIETSTYARARSGEAAQAVAVVVFGPDPSRLARAVTHAIATTRVAVDLVEPIALPLDAIRTALAARAIAPPTGPAVPVSTPAGPVGPASTPPSGGPA